MSATNPKCRAAGGTCNCSNTDAISCPDQYVAAPLPAAPAPTDGEKFRAHLKSASETVATWPAWKRLDGEAPTEQAVELPPLPDGILTPIPLVEPVYIAKALLAHREAHVVLNSGVGPVAAVHLVNIGLTGWTHNVETATAYTEGYNTALKQYRAALAALQAPAVAANEEWMDTMRELVSDFRKATYEFARGQDPADHALMMERQGQIFAHVRAARQVVAPASPKQVGWMNVKFQTFFKLGELAETDRTAEMLNSSEIIRVYSWLAPDAGMDARDGERFATAIALEDNAEALYGAVMSHAPDGAAIRHSFDAYIAREKAQ